MAIVLILDLACTTGLSNVISLTTYPTVCNDVYQTQCVTDKNVHNYERLKPRILNMLQNLQRPAYTKLQKKSSLQASLKVEEQAP